MSFRTMDAKNSILNELLLDFYKNIEIIVRTTIVEELRNTSKIDHVPIKDTSDFLTASEAAKFLGRKLSTLYKDVHLGNIPYHRSGARKLLFSRKELENFVIKIKTKSKSEIELEVTKYLQSRNL